MHSDKGYRPIDLPDDVRTRPPPEWLVVASGFLVGVLVNGPRIPGWRFFFAAALVVFGWRLLTRRR